MSIFLIKGVKSVLCTMHDISKFRVIVHDFNSAVHNHDCESSVFDVT